MIKVSVSTNSMRGVQELFDPSLNRQNIMAKLEQAGQQAKVAMQNTSLHGDITGLGRKSHKVVVYPAQLQVDVVNTATNDGFHYMPHIDRGGRTGKGGFIRARQFSQEGTQAGLSVLKSFKSASKSTMPEMPKTKQGNRFMPTEAPTEKSRKASNTGINKVNADFISSGGKGYIYTKKDGTVSYYGK